MDYPECEQREGNWIVSIGLREVKLGKSVYKGERWKRVGWGGGVNTKA